MYYVHRTKQDKLERGKTMKRNWKKMAEVGRSKVGGSRYDLSSSEVTELLTLTKNHPFEAIGEAFYLGVEVGRRQERRKK